MSVKTRETLTAVLIGASLLIFGLFLGGCGRVADAEVPDAESAAAEPAPAAAEPERAAAKPAPLAQPSGTAIPADEKNAGAEQVDRTNALVRKARPTSCSQAIHVPDLLYLGGAALRDAIILINRPARNDALANKDYYEDADTQLLLRDARDCYTRTLQSSPNNYMGLLGLGIANTMGALMESDDPELKASYIQSAKRLLGRAYVVRQGPYEPIYYLAHIAIIEGKREQAAQLLNLLLQAGYKPGSVYALFGQIASQQGDDTRAEQSYRKVLETGASAAELNWALNRLAALRAKRKK